MKEIKYQQKYVRQLAEGGTGTDVSFMRFNFPFGLELFAPCHRAFSFYDAFKWLMGTIGSRKVRYGLRQILFHQRERKISRNLY